MNFLKMIARWFIWLPLVLLLGLFLLANSQPVSISFDPVSSDSPALATYAFPLWLWLSISLLTGFFIGAFGMWNSGRAKRAIAKEQSRELKLLRRQLAVETEKAATATESSELPVLNAS